MRISIISLLFVFFSQSLFAAAKIEHWQTPQGTSVFYVKTSGLPMLDVRVVFDAGSARDNKQYGLAALTSTLLNTGAGDWNADMIAQRFESVGAQFGSGVNRDMAWLSLRSLTEKKLLDKALNTLQRILSQPAFNEADFLREKNRTLAGLKHREELPGALASMAFYKALYKDHPYAHPTEGLIETVSSFSRKDIRQFYQQYYVAKNASVVLVGDLPKEQAKQISEFLVAGLAVGEKPDSIVPVKVAAKAFNKHIQFPSTQTHVLAGLVGMHRKDDDYMDLYVGNHILGGSGLVSQLFKQVRDERGLAYSAYSYFSPMFRRGPFTMGLQTRNDQTTKAVDVMQNTLTLFVEQGPTEEALTAAKKNITGGFALRLDTNSKLTSYVAMIGFYQLPLDYLDTFQKRVEAVTADSIKDAFRRRVKPESVYTITVGGNK